MDHKEYRLAAIVFTDIVGFSRMMEKDETATLKLMEFHNEIVRRQVAAFGGKVIKTIGDAFLAEYPNATNAVRCAIEIQRELERFNATKPANPLVLRIGVHLGDIYFFENDALGEGINIASRLQGVCKPGRICISQEVNNLVANKIEVPIVPLGAVALKNISKGITAYEVLTNGAAEEQDPARQALEAKAEEAAKAASVDRPSSATSGSGSQPSAATSEWQQRIRSQVFSLIKQEGRRLSPDEVLPRLDQRGPEVEAFLEEFVAKGFLSRSSRSAADTPRSTGTSSGSGSRPYESSDSGAGRPNRDTSTNSSNSSSSSGSSQSGNEFTDAFRNIGREIKLEFRGQIQKAIETVQDAGKNKQITWEEYVERTDREAKREKAGFKSHFSSYIGVNALLFFIWAVTTGFAGFFWPAIVATGWGIGLATHFAGMRQKQREAGQVARLGKPSKKGFSLLRKLFKERGGWIGHLVSNVSVFVLLLTIWSVVALSGGFLFPWPVFPIAGMAIGLFAHLPAFKTKEQELLKELAAEGVAIEVLTDPRISKAIAGIKYQTGTGPIAAEAEALRERILRQLKTFKGNNPLGPDFVPVLENYVKQIKELSIRDFEIGQILQNIPERDLDAEELQLRKDMEGIADIRLKAEYEKALAQLEKQKKVWSELVNEQKVLKLRLTNALNSLKQLEIDMARTRSLSSASELGSAGALRAKSSELDQYLHDLRSAYQETEKATGTGDHDPLAEVLDKLKDRPEYAEAAASSSNSEGPTKAGADSKPSPEPTPKSEKATPAVPPTVPSLPDAPAGLDLPAQIVSPLALPAEQTAESVNSEALSQPAPAKTRSRKKKDDAL